MQAVQNPVYRSYLNHLGISPGDIDTLEQIPFLPISFFRSQAVKTGDWEAQTVFLSSGTTSATTSRHFVRDLDFYRCHAVRCFEYFFGPLTDYHLVVLVPDIASPEKSSLLTMLHHLVRGTRSGISGFYYGREAEVVSKLKQVREDGRKILIWGVTYALLDFSERFRPDLGGCIVLETGGMKGRRAEITREEVHQLIRTTCNNPVILSEYGMTELLSQAYLTEGGGFRFPPWARVRIRELTDPFNHGLTGQAGGVNVIDLANFDSVSFIETQDLGKAIDFQVFEISGRIDNSDLRGCNLLIG